MKDWWHGCVIYQVYPRSFQDSNGDGAGDIAGIIQRLPYLADLGIDAVWLSPIFPSPMDDMGYDVSDYTDVDPIFGSLEDFQSLLQQAHELGLKIIIDQVLSHTSSQHPWFLQSRQSKTNPRSDWYVWADAKPDGTAPNNWLSVFGGPAWEWDAKRQQYYLHNFLSSQPDLNYHNPEVQQAILEVIRFWLDLGVDGLRLDTVNVYFHDSLLRDNPPLEIDNHHPVINPYDRQDHVYSKSQPDVVPLLQKIRSLMDQYPERTSIGEIFDTQHAVKLMAEYTNGHHHLHMAYSFDLLGDQFTAEHFQTTLASFYQQAQDGCPCWSFSSHDVVRHVSRWQSHSRTLEALAKQCIALLISLQGSICLYQGEELGQTDTDLEFDELVDPAGIQFWPENKGRDGCRTPMVWSGEHQAGFSQGTPWLPIKTPQAKRHVAGQQEQQDSVLNHYRSLLGFRHTMPALIRGNTVFFDLQEPILAFSRKHQQQELICVFNLSVNTIPLAIQGIDGIIGPSQSADARQDSLTLGANGFAFLTPVQNTESVTIKDQPAGNL